MWIYTGKSRPNFADETTSGQESVWDYPRPPLLKRSDEIVVVRAGSYELARTSNAVRILETASPPGYYIPKSDINMRLLQQIIGSSFCEWKGKATYWGLAYDQNGIAVAWGYDNPLPAYAGVKDHLSFYPGRVKCFVNDERVLPQPGNFYGGWITKKIAGPFKGDHGTEGW